MNAADKARQQVLAEFRATSKERLERINYAWIKAESDPSDVDSVAEVLRELHSLKGESKMMGFADASLVAHRAEELVIWVRNRGFDDADDVGDVILTAVDVIGQLLEKTLGSTQSTVDLTVLLAQFDKAQSRGSAGSMAEHERSEAHEQPSEPRSSSSVETRVAPENTLRVDVDAVSEFSEAVSETVVAHARYEYWTARLKKACEEVQDDLARLGILRGAVTTPSGGTGGLPHGGIGARTLQILTRFHTDVQSIVEGQGQDIHEGNIVARELDHRATRLRLVPIRGLLSRYVRVVRDLAHENGKLAVCDIEDRGVSLDKNVADRLAEPLLHVIRNGIDHGVESPVEREQQGKPKEARVCLSASQQGGAVTVTVEDDGRGIDIAAVRRRAVELGGISVEASEAMRDEEALGLLFHHGFSTRALATETSGRGVGLDVVKRQVEAVGGTVHVHTVRGAGTRFELQVPTTIALTRVLIVRVGAQPFAIPVAAVSAVLLLQEQRIEKVHNHLAVRANGEAVRIAHLASLLGYNERTEATRAVVVSHEGGSAAFLVTAWNGDSDVVVKPLERLLQRARIIKGACLLEGGEVALILDPAQLVARAMGDVASTSTFKRTEADAPTRYRILVVDDSAITRGMVTRLLSAVGYDIRQAEDGLQALEVVRSEAVDLVLTDIDMPNMTGVELIREVRATKDHRNLPIIVMSTRSDDADKRVAIEAGADAYLVKTEFSERTLHEVIARRLG